MVTKISHKLHQTTSAQAANCCQCPHTNKTTKFSIKCFPQDPNNLHTQSLQSLDDHCNKHSINPNLTKQTTCCFKLSTQSIVSFFFSMQDVFTESISSICIFTFAKLSDHSALAVSAKLETSTHVVCEKRINVPLLLGGAAVDVTLSMIIIFLRKDENGHL